MSDLEAAASLRLALAEVAVERIVNGTPEQSGDLLWAMVERGKRQWAMARRLSESLDLSSHDVLSILRAVDEAARDGHGSAWVVRWVDARRLNTGPEATAYVVAECAAALDVTFPPEVEA